MDIDQIKQVLERYTQGKCTPAEQEVIEKWFASINQHQTSYFDDELLQAQLNAVQLRIHQKMESPKSLYRRLLQPKWVGLAASILICIVVVIYALYTPKPTLHPSSSTIAVNSKLKTNKIIRNGYVEITTAKGSNEKLLLADGSTVQLNASSKLRYPVDFGPHARNIYLDEGEAYFKVATDAKRPFTVHTAELATTALGTSFNIRAYAHENKITVALLTGKVQIDHVTEQTQSTQPAFILLPSELLSYDRKSFSIVKTSFEQANDIVGWKQGYLVFKDAGYQEVITEIENRYDVTIINQSDKKDWNYTGYFKDENLQDVIETICLTKNIDYTITNDTIILKSKN
ncbi:FecR family protein [Chitinophaga skermanii]|uniref:FecR family protein n=1 Tax=Chitinophaga skermanii TaxID=331697 RepID=A0A327QF11_9BACT|nr:FecR family protein [Chitinophaga skermanii]RAJ02585.1 FecR family protein [Chitinophaga skermanii]